MKLKLKACSSNCVTDARAALLPDYGMPEYGMPDHGSGRPFFRNSTAALINRPPRLTGNLARARLASFLAVTSSYSLALPLAPRRLQRSARPPAKCSRKWTRWRNP